MKLHRVTNAARQGGQSMTEFIIIAPVLLFLCFGILQFVFIYQAKATLDAASLEAARSGAVNNGTMESIRGGLARGLAPLHTHQSTREGYAAGLAKAQEDVGVRTDIEILNPTSAMVQDFARPRYYPEAGVTYTEIPNDTLIYRNSTVGSSGVNIQDANLLKIRVHYCYEMIVPLANRTIYYALNAIGAPGMGGILAKEPTDAHSDPYGAPKNPDYLCKTRLADGVATGHWLIPLQSEAIVRMQSAFRAETGQSGMSR